MTDFQYCAALTGAASLIFIACGMAIGWSWRGKVERRKMRDFTRGLTCTKAIAPHSACHALKLETKAVGADY